MVNELLFVPRKYVRLSEQLPGVSFIHERLDGRGTSLSESHASFNIGLTSGLRSVIVRDKEDYYRLKGVAPYSSVMRHGLCSSWESDSELNNSSWLFDAGFTSMVFSGMACFFVDINRDIFSKDYSLHSQGSTDFPCSIPRFKISGDTRVDELFYDLTKKELSGSLAKKRDLLMQDISYRTGDFLGRVHAAGYASESFAHCTNSHLGNFVVEQNGEDIKISLVDLMNFRSGVCKGDLLADARDFRFDFFAKYTVSHPVSLRYRHFSKDLQKNCWNHFKSAYNSGRGRNLLPVDRLSSVKHFSAEECREVLDGVRRRK
jgi:hypothetical protein